MKKYYCVLVNYLNCDVKNVCKDLSICYWGDGSSDDYCFDTREEAEKIMEAYKQQDEENEIMRTCLEIEENTVEELEKVREWARIGTAFILACREKNNA